MHDDELRYWKALSDKQLLDFVFSNNAKAIEYLFYYRYKKVLASVKHNINTDFHDEAELLHELYLKFHENDWRILHTFRYESSLDTFLFSIAINFIADKKTESCVISSEPETIEKEDTKNSWVSFLEEADRQLTEYEVYQAISSIRNPRYRYVLMSMLSGMSAQAIADEMRCKLQRVYNLTKRAKKELEKKLNHKTR